MGLVRHVWTTNARLVLGQTDYWNGAFMFTFFFFHDVNCTTTTSRDVPTPPTVRAVHGEEKACAHIYQALSLSTKGGL